MSRFYGGLCSETADKLPDVVQDGLLIARESPMIRALKFDISRLRDMACEVPSGPDANSAVVATVEHQRRHGNST